MLRLPPRARPCAPAPRLALRAPPRERLRERLRENRERLRERHRQHRERLRDHREWLWEHRERPRGTCAERGGAGRAQRAAADRCLLLNKVAVFEQISLGMMIRQLGERSLI